MTIVVGGGGPVLMNDPFDFSGLSGSVGTGIPTATNFATLNLSVGGLWQFQGVGFGNFVGGIATVGTITEFSFTRLSSRVATFSGLSLPMNTLLTLSNQNNLSALLNIMFGGDDTITGSAQDDFLFGYGGSNTLSGGDGNDNLLAGDAMDILDGGAGVDHAGVNRGSSASAYSINVNTAGTASGITLPDGTVIRNVESISITTGSGADAYTATGLIGNNAFVAGDGQDQLFLDLSATTAPIFTGSNFLSQRELSSTTFRLTYDSVERVQIAGGSGNDSLGGALGDDVIIGGLGDDSLFGDSGSDNLNGGDGDDRLQGDDGSDTLIGGNGADSLFGNAGDDLLVGGDGDDSLSAGDGVNTLVGGNGDDFLGSVTGVDDIDGGVGLDTISLDRSSSAESFTINFDGVSPLTFSGGTVAKNVERFHFFFGSGSDTLITGGFLTGFNLYHAGDGEDRLIIDLSMLAQAVTLTHGGAFSFLSSATFSLDMTFVEIFNVTGGGGGDSFIGGGGDDTLVGGAGNDVLNGGAGADHLVGGTGNDLFVVHDATDVVTEFAGEGADRVRSFLTWFLEDNVENLTLVGAAAIDGSGNGAANVIIGNDAVNQLFGLAGNDTLDGGAGADSLFGGLGDDLYIVDNAGDFAFEGNVAWGVDLVQASVSYALGQNIDNLTLVGAALVGNGNLLANAITGNANANTLFGMAGNDTLNGGAGADQMFGGLGDDLYIVDDSADFTFEAQSAWGNDTVQTNVDYQLGLNIDNLVLQAGAGALIGRGNLLNNTLTGNESANTLFGFAGNDTLDGGAGADQLYGREGDDAYIVDNVGDVVAEVNAAWGTDTIFASVTYFLSPNIEHLTLTGAANINGNGNSLNNTLTGNAGANSLSGQLGNDVLDGGAGADALFGGEGDDVYIVDNLGDVGFEANAAWGIDLVQSSVSHTLGTNLDNLTLTRAAAINATGNGLANALTGNSAANTLSGLGGGDTLNGGAGNDALDGGAGDDAFVFAPGSGSDTVSGFIAGGAEDSINLSAYNGSGVTWTITQAGADTVFAFSNGDQITLTGVTAANLVQTDPFGYS